MEWVKSIVSERKGLLFCLTDPLWPYLILSLKALKMERSSCCISPYCFLKESQALQMACTELLHLN